MNKDIAVNAWNFAKRVAITTNYSDSNQSKLNKIRIDHFVSKLGEEAAKAVLSQFVPVQGPDYTIYKADEKSWDADLFINGTGMAVKDPAQTFSFAIWLVLDLPVRGT